MSHRQQETTNATAAPTQQTAEPEREVAPSCTFDPLMQGAAGSSDDSNPSNQAATLNQATGGQLTRASHSVLQLQRTQGNHYVQQVVGEAASQSGAPIIQAKMTLGPTNDRYEREADRVAQHVVNNSTSLGQPDSGQSIQRQIEDEDEELLQRMPDIQRMTGAEGGAIDAGVQQSIQQARGGGHLLPENVRGSMEQAFGANFGGVRIHTDTKANQLNQSLQAHAFTTGQDIYFRRGAYDPIGRRGQMLLAHELTHVIQQDGSGRPQRMKSSLDTSIGSPVHNGPNTEVIQRNKYKFRTLENTPEDEYDLIVETDRFRGLTQQQQAIIGKAVELARAWTVRALQLTREAAIATNEYKPLDSRIATAVSRAFLIDLGTFHNRTKSEVLTRIFGVISRLKLDERQHIVDTKKKVQGYVLTPPLIGSQFMKPKIYAGKIHINLNKLAISTQTTDMRRILLTTRELATIIIHEATHKYVGTLDHAYRPFTQNLKHKKRARVLTKREALENADSFADYIARVNGFSSLLNYDSIWEVTELEKINHYSQ